MYRQSRAGFSLIELLVVLFIIGLVVAIVIPALGAARTVARKTSTQALINQVGQGAMQFQTDERRVPGAFSARDMGATENATRGMSGMENMMLDLAGGVVGSTTTETTVISVGPFSAASKQLKVDTAVIGVKTNSNNIYFAPPAKNYVAQISGRGQIGDVAHAGATEGDVQLKDLVDDFGQPLLAWTIDEGAIGPVTTAADFARVASDGAGNGVSRFYWNQNACFLNAPALGKLQKDQVTGSILSDTTNKLTNMRALLGNPSAVANPNELSPAGQRNLIIPAAARGGKFVIQSAGADGIFLGASDKGMGIHAGARTAPLPFGANFKRIDNYSYPKSIDVLVDFDDIIVGGGS
ncbi:MAG: prepilin-type N-terminal cleavage/methylation domain-containing protein [Planctomycetes bacterium]|nr:prepilin-type N-terminal cleavage/methylation domain-containing protein [Planctomycetota bacterium]